MILVKKKRIRMMKRLSCTVRKKNDNASWILSVSNTKLSKQQRKLHSPSQSPCLRKNPNPSQCKFSKRNPRTPNLTMSK